MKSDLKLKSRKEVLSRLNKSQRQIVRIIGELGVSNWPTLHKQIELAVLEIKSATELLAKNYITHSLIHGNIDEVMKTYKYLN